MVQRKIVPCCLPPASWDSDVPAHISCFVHPSASGPVPPQPSSHSFPSYKSELSLTSPFISFPLLAEETEIAMVFFFKFSFLISDYTMSFGRKVSIYMAKIWLFSHMTAVFHLLWAPQSHLCLLLVTSALSPTALSKRKLHVWAWWTEWDTWASSNRSTCSASVQPLLSYQCQSSYLSLHSQHNIAH